MKQSFTLSLPKISLLAAMTMMACDAYAATVTSGSIDDAELKADVYFRHFVPGWAHGQRKVRLTAGDTSEYESNNPAMRWNNGRSIIFEYDAAKKELIATVIDGGNNNINIVNKFDNVELNALNYLELEIKVSQASVQFNSAKLNGDNLSIQSLRGTQNQSGKWHITGEDLSQGFTLQGDIVLTGNQPMGDANYIQISVGYADQTGPKIDGLGINPNPAVLNGTTTLRATVSDADTGNNTIAGAEYSLNGGDWEPLAAQDGQFDEVSEDVIAELPATQLGSNEVCVRGTDSKGNTTTPPTCTTFLVSYQFEGFGKPIDNGLINTAKAGQSVPAKWRLTDADGVPVSDPASVAGFYSYPVDCEEIAHSPHDAIEEYAPGNSGLQYQGNGHWQYNWKTPKQYWGMCRAMYIEFNSGAISPVELFQFK